MFTAALTLGVAVSVVLAELLALSPGGIVTPGYVALLLDRPAELAGLTIVTVLTHAVMRLLTPALMLYGSRKFGVTLLTGMAFGLIAEALRPRLPLPFVEWAVLGHIVPGLIAYQWDRQGIVPTTLAIVLAAGIVRVLTELVVRL